ncbi:MAG: BatD family protein [Desulfovibrionaceae bacterium]
MRRTLVLALGGLLMLAVAACEAGAASVSASVNRDMIPAGQSVVLTVTVHDGEGAPDVSGIRDFQVARSGKSTSVQIVNGRRTSTESFSFLLVPRGEGELTIPAIDVAVDGKVLRTDPITVTVGGARDVPATAPDAGGDQDVLLTAEASRQKVYLGEPVLYTVAFYTSVRVTNFRFEPPEFQGFSMKDMGERSGDRRLGGKTYEAHLFPWLLTPIKPGNHTIAPARAAFDMVESSAGRGRFPRSPFDVFDDPFFGSSSRLTPRTLRTEPVELEVLPLPAYEGDAPFTGLVGEFEMVAKLSRESIEQGGSATLSLTFSGRGNVMDAEAPELDAPRGLKVYMDAPEEEVSTGPKGYAGTKTFRYALVGLAPGSYDLGPVRAAWFDVEQGRYRTAETEALRLEVSRAAAAGRAPADEGPAASETPREVTARYQDILPLKDSPLQALEDRPVPSVWVFLAGLLLPPLGSAFLAMGLRMARRDRDRVQELARLARSRVRAAAALAEDPERAESLYAGLRQALLDAVQAPSGSPAGSLTREEVRDELSATGRDSLADEAMQALDALDEARYGGRSLDASQRRELAERLRKLVGRLTA